jgi:hypothetical protein
MITALVGLLLAVCVFAAGAVQAAVIYRRHLADLARRHEELRRAHNPHVFDQLIADPAEASA